MVARITMTFKKCLSLFLPPILAKGASKIRNLMGSGMRDSYEYCPDAWERVVRDGNKDGWNVERLVEDEKIRWNAFCCNTKGIGPVGFSHEYEDSSVVNSVYFHNVHMTFGYVLALTAMQRSTATVLDYGGSLGHYHVLAKALLPDLCLDYHVKEVPKMAAMGRRLNPEIHWYENDDCLNRSYDLIMSNGSLDYIQDWKECVRKFGKIASGYVLITRTKIVSNHPTFPAFHCTPYGKIAHWQINETELLNVARSSGLKIVRELVVGDPVYTRGAPDRCFLKGWLFRKDVS